MSAELELRYRQVQDETYGPLFDALYAFADRTLTRFFDDVPDIPAVVLTMERDRYGRAGFFTPMNGALLRNVINLNPFGLRDGKEAAETIAHELVHHWQTYVGASTDHDEEFHQTMMTLYGISTHGSEGRHGGHDERWDEWMEENADLGLERFLLPGMNARAPRRMKKHVCPECLASFHSRTEMYVLCGKCRKRFVIESTGR